MVKQIACSLFVEDRVQESAARSLIECVFSEAGLPVTTQLRTGLGGFGAMLSDLKGYGRRLESQPGAPDLIVVLIDEDGQGANVRRKTVQESLPSSVVPHSVIGIPEPRIEDWYLADGAAWADAYGVTRAVVVAAQAEGNSKCGLAKLLASEDMSAASLFATTDAAPFADDLVTNSECTRASIGSPSLLRFIQDLRGVAKVLGA
ncbi:MAG: hypothetical protein PGN13_03430 [Patulibacter minatonensis]